MLLRTDGGLHTIGMRRRKFLPQRTHHLIIIIREVDVILLIHRLEFGMEPTDDHVLEPVTLDLRPVLDLVGRDILRIAGHIVGGKGVRPLCPDGGHEFVVLIGDEILGSHLTHGVDPVIGLSAQFRVRELTIRLIAGLDILQQGGLCLGIGGPEMCRPLKHQVLEVVRQTRRLCGVILRTRPHGDIRLNPRLLIVHREIHLQSIIQGIDACPGHIARYALVRIVFCLCANAQQSAK